MRCAAAGHDSNVLLQLVVFFLELVCTTVATQQFDLLLQAAVLLLERSHSPLQSSVLVPFCCTFEAVGNSTIQVPLDAALARYGRAILILPHIALELLSKRISEIEGAGSR